MWTRSWRCRKRWCWSTYLKPYSRISSASPAGWWNMDETRVRCRPPLVSYFRQGEAFYQTFVSVCRFHERLLPDQIQSAGSIHQRTEGTLPEEQRLLWCPVLACCPDQAQGHAHQKGPEETRSATTTRVSLIRVQPRVSTAGSLITGSAASSSCSL